MTSNKTNTIKSKTSNMTGTIRPATLLTAQIE